MIKYIDGGPDGKIRWSPGPYRRWGLQVKAVGATMEIGDGLREMLLTALFNTNRFIVLERQAIQDIMLEQDLGASGRVKTQTAAPIGQLEGAEILVYGVVSEFQMGSSGGGLGLAMPKLPFRLGGGVRNAHLAIDLRVVDAGAGRVVAARRIAGSAALGDATAATTLFGGKTEMPISLSAYQNTPMELAIRDCIYRAVIYVCHAVPHKYFRH